MSKTIENNVVQMTFDNKDFEKNISTSTKSVEKFNDSLDFKDAKKGFDDLEKYANSVNFDGLNKAIGNINSVFTVTGNMTKKIIDDIAGYFESKIVGTVSKVTSTISYIADMNLGLSKYEDYMTAMNTMRYNLSEGDLSIISKKGISDLEYLSEQLAPLKQFTDETSFNMLRMVSGISKYSAANVDLKKSVPALMGISLAAASAGKNADEASRMYEQMVQAISRGYFQMKDFNEAFANNNVATRNFKKTLVETAQELGSLSTLDEADMKKAREWAAATQGDYLNFFFTADNLNKEAWLTTDVILGAAQKYYQSMGLIFETTDQLADISVSQMVSWSKEFMNLRDKGVSAAAYVEYLGNEFDITDKEARLLAKSLNTLTSEEYKMSTQAAIAGQQATSYTQAIDAVREAFGTNFMNILTNFIGNVDQASSLWTAMSDNLWAVFAGPLAATEEGLERFNKEIVNTIDIGGVLVGQTLYDQFWKSIRRIFGGGAEFVNGFIDQIRILGGAFEEVDGELEIGSLIENNTFGFMQKLTNGVTAMADAIEKFLNSTLYENMLGIFMNILKIISNIKSVTNSLLRATVGTILKNLGKPLTALSELILKITGIIEEKSTKFVNSDIFKNVIKWLTSIIDAVSKLAGTVLSKLFNILGKIADIAGDFFGEAVRFLKPIFTWLHDRISPALKDVYEFLADRLNEALDWISDKLDRVGDAWDYIKLKAGEVKDTVKDFIEGLMGTDFDTLGEKLKNFGKNFMEGASGIGGRSLDVIKEYGKNMFDENADGSFPNLFKRLDDAGTAIEGAQTTIRWLGDALSNPIYFIFDLVGAVLNTDLSGAADALCNFIKRVTGAIADITPSALEFLSRVISFLGFLIEKAVELIKSIVGFATGTLSSTGSTILDKLIESVIKILDLLLQGFIMILMVLGDVAEHIKPAALAALDLADKFLTSLLDRIKEIIKNLSDASGDDIIRSVIGLGMIAVGLWLLFTVLTTIFNALSWIHGLGGPVNKIATGVYYVLDSTSGLLDTISGYNVAGMILYFSLLLFAISSATSELVKVAEMFGNEQSKKQFLEAMGVMLAFFLIILYSIKRVFKQISGLTTTLVDNGQFGSIKYNVAQTMIGMAAMVFSISFAMSKLIDATKDLQNPDVILYCGLVISLILLSVGKMMKMVQSQGSSLKKLSKDKTGLFKSNINAESSSSGVSYTGLASALRNLGIGLGIIMLSMGFLAKTVDGMKDPNWIWKIWIMTEGLLLSIFFVVNSFLKYSRSAESKSLEKIGKGKNKVNRENSSKVGAGGILNAAGVALLIFAVTGFVVVVMSAITALAAVVQHNNIDIDLIMSITLIVVLLILAIGAVTTMILNAESKQLAKIGIKELLQRLTRLISLSLVFTTLAIALAAIAGSIAVVTKISTDFTESQKKEGSESDGKMNPIWQALIVIGSLLLAMLIGMNVAIALAKNMPTEKILSVGLIIFGCALMIKNIADAIKTLTETFDMFEDSPNAIMASILGLILVMGMLAILVAVVGGIGSALGATKGTDGGTAILKLAAGLFVLAIAIDIIVGSIIDLAKAIHSFGDTTPIWEALKVGVVALLGLIAFIALLGVIGMVAGPALAMIGLGLLMIAGAALALDLALLLLIPAIELASAYLVDSGDKVKEVFLAIGNALAMLLVGTVVGFIQGIAELVEPLADALLELLNGLLRAVNKWAQDPETGYLIGEVIANLLLTTARALLTGASILLVALGDLVGAIWDWIKESVFGPIAKFGEIIFKLILKGLEAWWKIVTAPFQWIVDKVKKIFGIGSPSKVFAQFGEWIMQGLLNGLNKLKDAILAPFKWIAEKVSNIWNGMVNACESMMEKLTGRDFQQEMSDKMAAIDQDTTHYRASMAVENAKAYFDVVNKLSSGNFNTAERANLEATKSKLEKNVKAMKKVAWDAAREMGFEVTAGFYEGINSGGDPYKLAQQYFGQFTAGGEDKMEIKSPSKVMEVIGNYIKEGLLNGLDISSMFGTGEGMMDSLMGGVSSAMPDMSSLGGEAASMFNGGFADNLDLTASGATFDMSGYNTNLGGGYSSIGSIDSMNFASTGGYSGLDATYAMNSATAMPDTVNYTSEDITNELKAMNKKLDAFQEAVDKMQDLDIYLDNGVLAGALAGPIDEELGRRANRKAARGGI